MPIATGLEREELEAELKVRWSGLCSRGRSWNARPVWACKWLLIPRSGLGFAGEEAV
jgi:hypothetical protein